MPSCIFSKIIIKDPLKDTMLIFTDGSFSGRDAHVVNGKDNVVQTDPTSAQTAQIIVSCSYGFPFFCKEFICLLTVIIFLELFKSQRLSVPCIKTGSKVRILFMQVQDAINQR